VPWLGTALVRLAATDRERAARVLFAGLAVQARRLGRPCAYDLELEGYEVRRVRLAPDGPFELVRVAEAPEPPAFGLAGPLEALVPLVAGGTARWARTLPGVRVTGRRRRLRRLLQVLREPTGFDALAAAGPRLDAVDLLAVVAAAIPPAATAGHAFTVGFEQGADGEPAHLTLADGAPATAGAGIPPGARATVRVEPHALAAFLAGLQPASGTGDRACVEVLLGLVDAAQDVV
jgi:hypothetical protein